MSAEKYKIVWAGIEAKLNVRVNVTSLPAVLRVEESIQSGVHIQFALRLAIIY